jgi:hypothetical protein
MEAFSEIENQIKHQAHSCRPLRESPVVQYEFANIRFRIGSTQRKSGKPCHANNGIMKARHKIHGYYASKDKQKL